MSTLTTPTPRPMSDTPAAVPGRGRAAVMLGRVLAGYVHDKTRLRRAARRSDQIPGSTRQITTDWLTAVLCAHTRGAEVTGFEVLGGSDGTSSRRSLRIHYNQSGSEAGLPTQVFTKAATGLFSRVLLGITGITMGEAIFFNDLRPHLELRSPRGYHATADPSTSRSIVLMEDLASRGWTFPDPMHNPITERDARDMIDQIAAYHATFWNGGPAPHAFANLPTAHRFQLRLNRLASFERSFTRGLERSLELLPPGLRERRQEIWPAFMRSLEHPAGEPQTLLHQDVHHGNWLRDPDGHPGLYDWQCVARGNWALDVAYALSATLTTPDRRAWEQELISRYIQGLGDRGVHDTPSWDEAWLHYRRQPLHAFVFGVFTNGQPGFAPQLQPADYTHRSIERIAAAVDDLQTLNART